MGWQTLVILIDVAVILQHKTVEYTNQISLVLLYYFSVLILVVLYMWL